MNTHRNIQLITRGTPHSVGPFSIVQPLPAMEIEQLSPFILLHHAPLKNIAPNVDNGRVSPHPHRGFEPVTFLFEGGIYHRDSMGNEGYLEGSGVQWMTSGSGVIHSEGPSPEFKRRGGNMEMIQLWVNLPAKYKMVTPAYQMIHTEKMPRVSDLEGVKLHLVAGSYNDLNGPATTFSPMNAIMGDIDEGNTFEYLIPASHNAMIYVLSGVIEIDGKKVEGQRLAVLDNAGDGVIINALEKARLLLLNGEPINEPMATHGPFVMNTSQEIHQAIVDYQMGKMGVLEGE